MTVVASAKRRATTNLLPIVHGHVLKSSAQPGQLRPCRRPSLCLASGEFADACAEVAPVAFADAPELQFRRSRHHCFE